MKTFKLKILVNFSAKIHSQGVFDSKVHFSCFSSFVYNKIKGIEASQVVDPMVPVGIDLAQIEFPFNYLLCSIA